MDIDKIQRLVELMVESDLSRIEISEGEMHVLLRRGQPVVQSQAPAMMAAAPAPAPAPAAPAAAPSPASPAEPAAAPVADANEVLVRSPMVGTYYAAADPESPPFIKVGDQVTSDTVVCLVEAMKVFNEIKAEVSGRITKVLVNNGEAIEFDQPLFAVAAG